MTHPLILRERIKYKKILYNDIKISEWKVLEMPEQLEHTISDAGEKGYRDRFKLGQPLKQGEFLDGLKLEHKTIMERPEGFKNDRFPSGKGIRVMIREVEIGKDGEFVNAYFNERAGHLYDIEEIDYINSHLEDDFK